MVLSFCVKTKVRAYGKQKLSSIIFYFTKNKETYFIDTKLNPEREKVLNNWTEKIKGFYEGKLKIPYKNYVAYLCTTPISKKNTLKLIKLITIFVSFCPLVAGTSSWGA